MGRGTVYYTRCETCGHFRESSDKRGARRARWGHKLRYPSHDVASWSRESAGDGQGIRSVESVNETDRLSFSRSRRRRLAYAVLVWALVIAMGLLIL